MRSLLRCHGAIPCPLFSRKRVIPSNEGKREGTIQVPDSLRGLSRPGDRGQEKTRFDDASPVIVPTGIHSDCNFVVPGRPGAGSRQAGTIHPPSTAEAEGPPRTCPDRKRDLLEP